MPISFKGTATTSPECQRFLKIELDGQLYTLEEFAEKHKNCNILEFENAVYASSIDYRGAKKKYLDVVNENIAFSESMPFFEFRPPMLLLDSADRASVAFIQSAKECLQNGRYFTMMSASVLDTNENINWSGGYLPQFLFRTINFSTAVSWYSNCFDQILQVAYWGYRLFTSAKDRSVQYDSSWDVEKTLKCCTYGFVKGELTSRGISLIENEIIDCMAKIQDVRDWTNYIKHKGGIGYKYLEAPSPVQFRVKMNNEPEYTAIDEYISPISIDIDDNIGVLTDTHSALFHCLTKIVNDLDFDNKAVQFQKQEETQNG